MNGSGNQAPGLILCGPQTQLPTSDNLKQLHEVLSCRGITQKLLPTVDDLPNVFKQLARNDQRLDNVPDATVLGHLQQWLKSGELGCSTEDLPNIVALPLTLLLQVAQYVQHLDQTGIGTSYLPQLEAVKDHGIQGFCIGFLTAAAIAFSGNDQELVDSTAVSLRLAVCIGTYIDRNGLFADPPDPACALSVRWKRENTAGNDLVEQMLQSHPEAYVSCLTDDTCVTVTASAAGGKELATSLREAGFRVKPVGINGRYHCSRVHSTAVEKIEKLCRASQGFQYPAAAQLKAPLRSNATGQLVGPDQEISKIALNNIMVDTADWYGTVKASLGDHSTNETDIVSLGFDENIMPLSLSQRSRSTSKPQVNEVNGVNGISSNPSMLDGDLKPNFGSEYPPHSIAVVGMACRFPGANSVEQFWDLLASGVSMVREPPSDRLHLDSHRTADRPGAQFWGNFIDDPDAFDHRFFKKSSREAVSWDPEKRVLLEVVYEALESAGHFSAGCPAHTDYGCYIGAVANNYYDNVACHPPTAYSMLGTSRAFFSGRISHQFGFTGPAMSIDTACSSSLVGINAACKSIQTGECTRAIAGGTNIFTSPFDYQNLAAAGFLSPTGACKPFDASADGYCRGEGVAVVVLKSLESAIEENDNILGVIVGSAVNQNLNDAHITVPNSQSQTTVYDKVLNMARADSSEVTYVEAHGTGTQIGDPIECQSIRDAFGGSHRNEKLYLGSVKGHIGHTEASAGVTGLIKTLLMIQKQTILGQASFNSVNPKIPALEPDMMEIPKKSQPWKALSHLACINSYGAAGSNAAVAVRQAPSELTYDLNSKPAITSKQPLFLSAASQQSLSKYCKGLLEFLRKERASTRSSILLADILFNVADRANHTLSFSLAQLVTDLDELEKKLEDASAGSTSIQKDASSNVLPLVMVFGGQENDYIGLSEDLFENTAILRHHLDECDSHLRCLGLPSLYPAIFQRSAISHLPTLHASLFAIQYSSAKCWIDCGIAPSAVVGHSFGQLTALCITGCLSLFDALKLVVGRAELISSSWGPEPGSMISLQADHDTVSSILTTVNADKKQQNRLEIACHNNPTSHVIVGSREGVSVLENYLANNPNLKSPVRAKRLNVTHGFHSMFTEPLLPALHDLASTLHWEKPQFHLELCTEESIEKSPGPWLIPEHTRKPVFFKQAIGRLAQKLGSCLWLEGGQRTSIMSLVQSNFQSKSSSLDQKFCPSIPYTSDSTSALADLTVELMKAGYPVRFWPYHRSQRRGYAFLNVPPYQFEKTKHWLPFVDQVVPKPSEDLSPPPPPARITHEFFSFMGFKDESEMEATFLIDPQSERYKYLLEGHITSKQALAPMSIYIELLSRTALHLTPQTTYETHVTSIESLQMKSPIGLDASRDIYFTLTRAQDHSPQNLWWSFVISTQAKDNKADSIVCATGQVGLDRRDDSTLNQTLKRYGSLIGFQRCLSILNSDDGEKMQGKHIYQAIQRLVHFDEMYQGIKSISCTGHEAAGRVQAKANPKLGPNEALYDTPVIDSLMQFAGILVNYFSHPSVDEVLVCQGLNRIVTGGAFDVHAGDWIAYALLTEDTDERTECDVYIFDAKEGKLVIAFMGFFFMRTSVSVLTRMLASANASGQQQPIAEPQRAAAPVSSTLQQSQPMTATNEPAVLQAQAFSTSQQPSGSKKGELHELLNRVTDIPVDEMNDDSTLEDLGIDSLMVTEVLTEIQSAFGLEIDLNEFLFFPNLKAIVAHIDSALGVSGSGGATTSADTSTTNPNPNGAAIPSKGAAPAPETNAQPGTPSLTKAHSAFAETKHSYDRFARETHAAGFWQHAYPQQAALVLAYVVEAFAKLGCDMSRLEPGDACPSIPHLPRHTQLVRQLFRVLEDANLATRKDGQLVRTSTPADPTPAAAIFDNIVPAFPQHASVHRLVRATGSELAPCLTGAKDGLQLVFGNRANKQNLDDVYENWPLVRSATLALGEFLGKALAAPGGGNAGAGQGGKFRILEVGAGTGGTTKYIVDHLQRLGVPFEYVFTDLSSSLVASARRSFKATPGMSFSVLDVEKEPPDPSWYGSFHVVISTNCIHATRDLGVSLTGLRRLLRDDGVLALVEITHNMFWLDVAVGLFEGWWLFEDGREHAVTGEGLWEERMRESGFERVDWTSGEEPEARTIRVVVGFASGDGGG